MGKYVMSIKKGIYNYWSSLFIWPILSTICFILYWELNINFFSYIGLLIYFIPIFFYDIHRCLMIYYFLLSNISMFKINHNSLALSSVFLIILFVKVLLNKKTKINLILLILLILYFIASILSYLLAQNDLTILSQEVRVVIDIFIAMSVIIIFNHNLKTFFNSISTAFILGCLLTSISGVIYAILQGNSFFNGYRLEAINSDPNYFSLCLAFSISLLLLKVYQRGSTNFDLILIVCFTIFGLMSLSRGFLISMAVNVLFFVYIFAKRLNTIKKFFIIFILIMVIFITYDFLYKLYINFENRFISEETSEGSGRLEIWKMYIDETFSSIKNLLFGIGVPDLTYYKSGTIAVQHNLYLELLTGKGIIGATVVILIYIEIFRTIKKYVGIKGSSFIAFVPIFTLATGFMFLNGWFSDLGIMTFFLGFLATNIYNMEICGGKDENKHNSSCL
jgi:O-Antigen ligase